MIEVEVKNIFPVLNQIDRLGRGLDDNRYLLMRRLSGTMHTAVMNNFRRGGRPKWLGLKYRIGKPLLDTGTLRQSITQQSDNDTALVFTNLKYAAIHHFGGKAGRSRKANIPARPFMQLTGQDKQDLMEDVQDYFRSLTRR